MKVLIIGSGLGGLSLAQSLQRAGIDFDLFERDSTPWDRSQGYRLHLDADAINTVEEVLTPELKTLFKETSQWTQPNTSIMKPSDLRVIKRILTNDDHGTNMWPTPESETPLHANVDRATLRQILLSGLGDSIHFGKKFERYETAPDNSSVTAYFTDGSTATGTVLVGADGVNSALRNQRAPNCRTMDAGVTAIYGRLTIDAVRKYGPPEALEDIFVIGSDERKVFLGLGSVQFPTPPDEAGAKYAPNSKIQARDSYAVCIVGGRHEHFPDSTRTATPVELQEVAASMLGKWSDNAPALIRAGDPDSFFVVHMRTSVPTTLEKSANVTLLGDAITSMTPSLGRGANLAMRHGTLLGRHLRKVAEGKGELAKELAAFESQMTEYGFKVVKEAAEIGRQRMHQNPLTAAVDLRD